MKTETKGKVKVTKISQNGTTEVVVKQPNEVVTYLGKVGLVDKPVGKQMVALLSEFYTAIDDWKDKVDKIVVTDESHTAEMELARAGRISLMKKRTAVEDLVKKQRALVKAKKADIDLEDTTWLRVFQIMEANFKNLEGKLREKEEFKERKEAQRKLELKVARIEKMTAIGAPIEAYKFDEMEEETFQAVYESAVQAKVDREKLEALEKAEREKEKELAAKAVELEKENEKLKVRSNALEELVKIGQTNGEYSVPVKSVISGEIIPSRTDKHKLEDFVESIEEIDCSATFKSKSTTKIFNKTIEVLEELVQNLRDHLETMK